MTDDVPPMNSDPAKPRFIVIQAMRWVGLALFLVGLLVINGKIPLPMEAGYVLALIGIVDALIMPTVLARRWRTPPS